MDENAIFKLALIFAIIGLLTLFAFSKSTEIKETKLNEINEYKIGEKVRVKGIITGFIKKPSVNFIEINNSKIQIVYFEEVELKKGDLIEIVGEVKLYRGKLEVVAQKIKKV